jgi:hypothetical protein
MFKGMKDAYFFSKVCGVCIKAFGVDLMPLDKKMNGQLMRAVCESRSRNHSPEQAATLGVSKGLRFLASKVNVPSGNTPDHHMYANWAMIVDGWAAQGLVDDLTRSAFADAVDFVLMMATKR